MDRPIATMEPSSSHRSTEGRTPSQLLLLALLLFVLAFAAIYLMGWEDWLVRTAAMLLGIFGLVLVGASVVFKAWHLSRRRMLTLRACLDLLALRACVLAPFGGAFVSVVVAESLNERYVTNVRQACRQLLPRLEAHRRVTGSFPTSIESGVDGVQTTDALAAVEYLHDGAGQRYRLWFFEPLKAEWGRAVHLYDSERASWFFSDNSSFDPSFRNDLHFFRFEGDV